MMLTLTLDAFNSATSTPHLVAKCGWVACARVIDKHEPSFRPERLIMDFHRWPLRFKA